MPEITEKIDFETALDMLEKAAAKLRSGECTLEESVKIYQDSVKYYDICREILSSARQKIEIYRPDSGKTEVFDEH